MFTRPLSLVAAATIVLSITNCSEPIDTKCKLNTDCLSGYLCNPSGECEKQEPVSIRAVTLPEALVGDPGYSHTLQADGGLAEFSWSLEIVTGQDELAWLTIAEDTGELHPNSGQSPTTTGTYQITVSVLDSSNGGSGQIAERPFDLTVINCRGPAACYEADPGGCQQGTRACVDGILAEECVLTGLSTDVDHCGPDCTPCGPNASRCEAGQCRCGSISPCQNDEACCGSSCYDLQTATEHCGSCELSCLEEIQNATNIRCTLGSCDWTTCDATHHDCDGTRQNGCETATGTDNCSFCTDDCTDQSAYPNTQDPTCEDKTCAFAACQPGFGDCSEDPGCETSLGSQEFCTDCETSCIDDLSHPLCLPDGQNTFKCGCSQDTDCESDRLCCPGDICLPMTESNCGECGYECSILEGGLNCVADASAPTGWSCQCSADNECRGVYDFSEADCFSSECICETDTHCSGTTDHMCCITASGRECVDLNTDAANCGACERSCATDQTCGTGCGSGGDCGACSCDPADGASACPNLSGEEWQCVNEACVCPQYSNVPCPAGQYCCLGLGCCLNGCNAPEGRCSNACLLDGDVWCYHGCCEDCADESECTLYEPAGFPFHNLK